MTTSLKDLVLDGYMFSLGEKKTKRTGPSDNHALLAMQAKMKPDKYAMSVDKGEDVEPFPAPADDQVPSRELLFQVLSTVVGDESLTHVTPTPTKQFLSKIDLLEPPPPPGRRPRKEILRKARDFPEFLPRQTPSDPLKPCASPGSGSSACQTTKASSCHLKLRLLRPLPVPSGFSEISPAKPTGQFPYAPILWKDESEISGMKNVSKAPASPRPWKSARLGLKLPPQVLVPLPGFDPDPSMKLKTTPRTRAVRRGSFNAQTA